MKLSEKQIQMLIPVYRQLGNYEDVSKFLLDKTGIKLSYDDYDRIINQNDLGYDLSNTELKNTKEYIKDYKRNYYKANKEKIKQRSKEYYYKNKDICKQNRKEYYHKNKEEIKDKSKKYYDKNKEKLKSYSKTYRKNNKKYHQEYRKTKAGRISAAKYRYKHYAKREEDFNRRMKYLFKYQIVGSNECENTYWKYDQTKNKIIWLKRS